MGNGHQQNLWRPITGAISHIWCWMATNGMRFDQAWSAGIWYALRAATGRPSPQPFSVDDLPVLGEECRRILKITAAFNSAMYDFEKSVIRKVVRQRQPLEPLPERMEKRYLSSVLDLYNREIVAWSMDIHPGMNLVDKMLNDALQKLSTGDEPVLHSDQGWQYQMASYQEKLSSNGVTQSMSRKGNCLDNAVMENFFGLLKSECWHNEKYEDTGQLKEAVNKYIHYYNHECIKEKLNGLGPVEYRTQARTVAR